MTTLSQSLAAFGTADFEATARREIEQLGLDGLPLQQGLQTGSIARDDKLSAMIIGVNEAPQELHVRAGLFYTSIIAGCACADDPTPLDENTEYCEVLVDIDRGTGQATVRLASD
ncbi:MAG TPA: hypothetical protein ENN42_01260 [Thioalkalivibrio sp.]|nr:hypothetical protein [Thioalkalivibrio sp.]